MDPTLVLAPLVNVLWWLIPLALLGALLKSSRVKVAALWLACLRSARSARVPGRRAVTKIRPQCLVVRLRNALHPANLRVSRVSPVSFRSFMAV